MGSWIFHSFTLKFRSPFAQLTIYYSQLIYHGKVQLELFKSKQITLPTGRSICTIFCQEHFFLEPIRAFVIAMITFYFLSAISGLFKLHSSPFLFLFFCRISDSPNKTSFI